MKDERHQLSEAEIQQVFRELGLDSGHNLDRRLPSRHPRAVPGEPVSWFVAVLSQNCIDPLGQQ